jgi:hypothetical protein
MLEQQHAGDKRAGTPRAGTSSARQTNGGSSLRQSSCMAKRMRGFAARPKASRCAWNVVGCDCHSPTMALRMPSLPSMELNINALTNARAVSVNDSLV